jgi:hypothetical protein
MCFDVNGKLQRIREMKVIMGQRETGIEALDGSDFSE